MAALRRYRRGARPSLNPSEVLAVAAAYDVVADAAAELAQGVEREDHQAGSSWPYSSLGIGGAGTASNPSRLSLELRYFCAVALCCQRGPKRHEPVRARQELRCVGSRMSRRVASDLLSALARTSIASTFSRPSRMHADAYAGGAPLSIRCGSSAPHLKLGGDLRDRDQLWFSHLRTRCRDRGRVRGRVRGRGAARPAPASRVRAAIGRPDGGPAARGPADRPRR